MLQLQIHVILYKLYMNKNDFWIETYSNFCYLSFSNDPRLQQRLTRRTVGICTTDNMTCSWALVCRVPNICKRTNYLSSSPFWLAFVGRWGLAHRATSYRFPGAPSPVGRLCYTQFAPSAAGSCRVAVMCCISSSLSFLLLIATYTPEQEMVTLGAPISFLSPQYLSHKEDLQLPLTRWDDLPQIIDCLERRNRQIPSDAIHLM